MFSATFLGGHIFYDNTVPSAGPCEIKFCLCKITKSVYIFGFILFTLTLTLECRVSSAHILNTHSGAVHFDKNRK